MCSFHKYDTVYPVFSLVAKETEGLSQKGWFCLFMLKLLFFSSGNKQEFEKQELQKWVFTGPLKKINNPVMDWDKTKTIGAENPPKNYG